MDPASWRRAKDVIAEALQLPAAERDRFVRAQCSDPDLADEILTMLAVEVEPTGAPGGGAPSRPTSASVPLFRPAPAPPPPPPRLADEDDLEPGTRVGAYVILNAIGKGGMGRVFLGSDPRLHRKVALKCVLRSISGSGERRLQIFHEARAAARVAHPNV